MSNHQTTSQPQVASLPCSPSSELPKKMNTYPTEKLASISDADLKEQTAAQHRAVAHMAKALAEVHGPHMTAKASRGALELQCVRSAEIMEMLGDTLNAMDAVDEKEDDWMTPIFEKANETFGDNNQLTMRLKGGEQLNLSTNTDRAASIKFLNGLDLGDRFRLLFGHDLSARGKEKEVEG